MPKDFTLNLEDTNCAKIGSPEDKEARKTAALTELAWEGCGQKVGVQIWRIEQFEVKVPFVRTCDNWADFFTKPMTKENNKFFAMRAIIMNEPKSAASRASPSQPVRQPAP